MTDQWLPKSVFRERLRTYLIGVGIGSILVGFMFMERSRRARLRQQASPAQVESGAPAPPAGGSQPAGKP